MPSGTLHYRLRIKDVLEGGTTPIPVDLESYSSTVDLLADFSTEQDPDGVVAWELALHPNGGTNAIQATIATFPTMSPSTVGISASLPGFTAGRTYRLSMAIYPEDNGSPFNFNIPRGARTTISGDFTADGSGNLSIPVGVEIATADLGGAISPPAVIYWDQIQATPLAGQVSEDDILVVSSVPSDEAPYLAEPPDGDGETLDPLTGKVSVGAYTVRVIDAARVVTAVLADAAARQQLLSKYALVDESEDEGSTWTVLLAGYVNRVSLVDALLYEFTIGESKRVEQSRRVFDRISDPVSQPLLMGVLDRASCLIGGPIIGDFAGVRDPGRPTFVVDFIEGGIAQLGGESGPFHAALAETAGSDIREDVYRWINLSGLEYLDKSSSVTVDGHTYAPLSDVVCRVYDVGTDQWIGDLTAMAVAGGGVISGKWFTTDLAGNCWVQWPEGVNANLDAVRSVGSQIKIAVFPTTCSPKNPFHFTGPVVNLAAHLLDYCGIPYNGDSLLATRRAIPHIVDLQFTQPEILQDALEKYCFGPFGFATRTNDAGEQEFFQTRQRGQTPVATLTVDELTTDAGTVWEIEESSAANKVVWASKTFFVNDAASSMNESSPIDCLLTGNVTIDVNPEDDDDHAIFGEREVRFEIPGEVQGRTGDQLETFVATIAQPLFDWQGRGAIRGEFHVRRGTAAASALIGQEVIVDVAHVPTASPDQSPTSQRGTVPRRGFVLQRTVTPQGATLKLEDRGLLDDLATDPVFTLAASESDPTHVGEADITNGLALAAAGVLVRVEFSQDGGTSWQHIRTWTPEVDATPFLLPAVCGGSIVTVRMRSEGTGDEVGQVGAFTAAQSLDLPDLEAPNTLQLEVIGQQVAMTWVNASTLPVEVVYRTLSQAVYTSAAILPAGSVAYTLNLPLSDTEYIVGVRHRDLPPLLCTSVLLTQNATSSVALGLVAPRDPAGYADGAGTFGLEVLSTELDASIVFEAAPETAIGSGVAGTFEVYGSTASILTQRVGLDYPAIAPNDGLRWFLRAKNRRAGFTDSAYTAEVSVDPWQIVDPPDPPVPPTGGVQAVEICIPLVEDRIEFDDGDILVGSFDLGAEHSIRANLSLYGATRVTATVEESELPAGTKIVPQYQDTDGEWQDLGAVLDIDTDTVALWDDGVMEGLAATLPEDARQTRRIRTTTAGGDGTGLVRFGRVDLWAVAEPEDPGGPEEPPDECESTPYDLEQFVDTAALLAVWDTELDVNGHATWELAAHPDGGDKAIKLTFDEVTTNPEGVGLLTTVSGFTPGRSYRLIVDFYPDDNGSPFVFDEPVGERTTGWVQVTADDDGNVSIGAALSSTATPGALSPPVVAYYDNFRVETLDCDLPVPPDDPGPGTPPPGPGNPPPPPITGDAIYGMAEIPNTGWPGGPWNSTIVKDVSPSNAASKFADMEAADMQNLWMPQGPQANWVINGVFNVRLYIEAVRVWATPSAGRTAAMAAIANGTVRYLYLIDEPHLEGRYGPGGISLGDIRQMVAVMREVFPDAPIVMRATPDTYNVEIPGLTAYWFALKATRLPVSNVEQHLDRAAELNAGLFVSINRRDFNDTADDDGNSSNNADGWITPNQLRQYGIPLAQYEGILGFYGWWMQDPEWYEDVTGMPEAEFAVRAALEGSHPPDDGTGGDEFFLANAESGTMTPPWESWGVVNGDDGLAPVNSTDEAYAGTRSFKFETAANPNENHFSQVLTGTPQNDMGSANGRFLSGWYSMRVFIDSGYDESTWNMLLGWMTGVASPNGPSPISHIGLEYRSGVLQVMYVLKNASVGLYTPPNIPGYTNSSGWYYQTASSPNGITAFPTGQWVHLSVNYVMSATNGRVTIYQDGVLVMNLTAPTMDTFGGHSTIGSTPAGTNPAGDMILQLGIYGGVKTNVQRMYLDNFRVTSQREEA